MQVLYFSLLGTTLASMLSHNLRQRLFITVRLHLQSPLRLLISLTGIHISGFVLSWDTILFQLVLLSYLSMLPFWLGLLNFPSVKAYLYVISLLHKEFSLSNPHSDNWAVKSLSELALKGLRRDSVKQKLPITVDILLRVHESLNLPGQTKRFAPRILTVLKFHLNSI